MPAANDITVTLDRKAFDRAMRGLDKYAERPLRTRAKKAYLVGVRLMANPIKARITAYGDVKTGRYRKSVKARNPKLRLGEMAAASVGPIDGKRHLLLAGHRIVTPGGRDTGRRTDAHPAVDDIYRAMGERVRSFIADRVLDLGETWQTR